jgi:hypothetical protein
MLLGYPQIFNTPKAWHRSISSGRLEKGFCLTKDGNLVPYVFVRLNNAKLCKPSFRSQACRGQIQNHKI